MVKVQRDHRETGYQRARALKKFFFNSIGYNFLARHADNITVNARLATSQVQEKFAWVIIRLQRFQDKRISFIDFELE